MASSYWTDRVRGLIVAGVLVWCAISASVAAATPVPTSEVAGVGTESAVVLSWPSGSGVSGYLVWRSIDPSSTAAARVVGIVEESGSGNSFSDFTVVFAGKYHYSIQSFGPGSADEPTQNDWTGPYSLSVSSVPSPHALASTRTELCIQCHALHAPTVSDELILADRGQSDTSISGMCLTCHETSVEPGGASVGVQFASIGSGHSLSSTECSHCHSVHGASAQNPFLRPASVRVGSVIRSVSPVTVNGWCIACHDGPVGDVRDPEYDPVTWYPISGMFPGVDDQSTLEIEVLDAHASIPASETVGRGVGDCRWCHASHRSASPYDGLLVIGDPETASLPNRVDWDNAPLCLTCHPSAVSEGEAGGVEGHFVQTLGGFYAPGTALPCYTCHNAHGSTRNNSSNLSDMLGGDLDPSAGALQERRFCFTCHAAEGIDGWYGWDSEAVDFVRIDDPTFTGMTSALGLSRVETETALALSADSELAPEDDPHGRDGLRACTECHYSMHDPKTMNAQP